MTGTPEPTEEVLDVAMPGSTGSAGRAPRSAGARPDAAGSGGEGGDHAGERPHEASAPATDDAPAPGEDAADGGRGSWAEDVYTRWHEIAVFYTLSIDTFQDSDGDGIGDLGGVHQRLDYLAGLGIDCVWLQPLHPSPRRDGGYDVTNYYDVDPAYGDLGDLVKFLDAASRRGIRVLLDLVVNHTSIDHPWFQAARRDRGSPYRDFYVWRDEPPEEGDIGTAFPGAVDRAWSWDEEAGQYYLHRFYPHQPDLNIANREVRRSILKLMRFWLRLGISGFRVDAMHFIARKAEGAGELGGGHDFLRQMRQLANVYGDRAILLAESDVQPPDYPAFFGDPAASQMHLLFNFVMNAHLFQALADQNARPLRDALARLPRPPVGAAYVNWVRNHDELNLERLDPEARQRVMDVFAPDDDMRVYGRGIRRRFAPMVGGDRRRIELAYSLVFSLPGVPMLRYGDEIGMGDDLSQPEREAVRTVMQWSEQPNGGFSTADPDELRRAVVHDGDYGFERVNVADQLRDPESLLSWMSRLVRTRKIAWPGSGAPDYRLIEHDCDEDVLTLRYDGALHTLLVLHNLSPHERVARVPGLADLGQLVELFSDRPYDRPEPVSEEDAEVELAIAPYGYRWIQAYP